MASDAAFTGLPGHTWGAGRLAPEAEARFIEGVEESAEVSCTWSNPESHSIAFPNEMCAFVGYYVSESPEATDIMCLTPL